MASEVTNKFQTFDEVILSGSCPVLFENAIEEWPARQWKPRDLAAFLGETTFKCKVAARHSDEIQWETNCFHLEATVQQFVDWLEDSPDEDNPFSALEKDKFSVYVDYKYMASMFEDKPHLLKAVRWDSLGLGGRGGESSTLWLGSAGASTPCHYDSYGFNLVAQLYGRKRWILFPPSNSMYPTRIPYEESSVFSEVNIVNPDLQKHPDFKQATPVMVELEPGQVLYVPHQWWHYVESLEPSISINTWVELDADDEERVREAIVRTLFSTLTAEVASSGCLPLDEFLNPNEVLLPLPSNLQYLHQTLGVICQSRPGAPRPSSSSAPIPTTDSDSAVHPAVVAPASSDTQHGSTPPMLAGTCMSHQAKKDPRLSVSSLRMGRSNLQRFAHVFRHHPVKVKSGQERTCGGLVDTPGIRDPSISEKLEREMSIDSVNEECRGMGTKTTGISDDERWRTIFDEEEAHSPRNDPEEIPDVGAGREGGLPWTDSASIERGENATDGANMDKEGQMKRRLSLQEDDRCTDSKMMRLDVRTNSDYGKEDAAGNLNSSSDLQGARSGDGENVSNQEQYGSDGDHSTPQLATSSMSSSSLPKRKVGRVEARDVALLSCPGSLHVGEKSHLQQDPRERAGNAGGLLCSCPVGQDFLKSGLPVEVPLEASERSEGRGSIEAYVLQTSTFDNLRQLLAGHVDSDAADEHSINGEESGCEDAEAEEGGEEEDATRKNVEEFVKAVLHPHVIQAITDVLLGKVSKPCKSC